MEEMRRRVARLPGWAVMMRSPGLERRVSTCRQRIWRRAMSLRSRGDLSAMAAQTRAAPAAAAARRDSASATTLDIPGRYTSWLVYSEMKARGRWLDPVEGKNQRFVIHPQLEGAALKPRAEVFYT